MTKEQDKAIERCNNLIRKEHSSWIGISNQKAIEKLLNMLKEKANTDLEFLNLGWKTEIEKKDKIIDLMAEQLIGLPVNKIKQDFEKPNFKAEITIFTDKEAIKQYFERKAINDA